MVGTFMNIIRHHPIINLQIFLLKVQRNIAWLFITFYVLENFSRMANVLGTKWSSLVYNSNIYIKNRIF